MAVTLHIASATSRLYSTHRSTVYAALGEVRMLTTVSCCSIQLETT